MFATFVHYIVKSVHDDKQYGKQNWEGQNIFFSRRIFVSILKYSYIDLRRYRECVISVNTNIHIYYCIGTLFSTYCVYSAIIIIK